MRSFVVYIMLLMLAVGCKPSINFTGGSIDPNIKTIGIQSFFNQSGNGPPSMSLQLTEKLRSFYQNNTKLLVNKESGDWNLEGKITKYFIQPVAPQQGQTAGLTRLTITVNATFKDEVNNRTFTKDFTYFDDFSQSQSLASVESEKVDYILNEIVLMIFNETTSNW